MFVRWQLYRSQALNHWHAQCNNERARHKAILVESSRINGKPRLKHVAFIASYETGPLDLPTRIGFWQRARQRLDQLDNRITPDDRRKIEAALARRVPPTTPEDERALEESWQRLKERLER